MMKITMPAKISSLIDAIRFRRAFGGKKEFAQMAGQTFGEAFGEAIGRETKSLFEGLLRVQAPTTRINWRLWL